MTATCVMHLEPVSSTSGRTHDSGLPVDNGENGPPEIAISALEKWNYPRHNIGRLMATFWSFVVSGANDAAYGVCLCNSI